MVDTENEAQEAPKPKPVKPKPAKSGGGAATGLAVVVAIAAIAFSIFLFMQLQSLKQKLGEVEPPVGMQPAEASENGLGEAVFDWQHDPQEIYYDLGKFQAKTKDDRYAQLDITLKLESGPSVADQEHYELMLEMYDGKMKKYVEEMKEYAEQHKAVFIPSPKPMRAPCILLATRRSPQVELAQHGAPAAEAKPPEMPIAPDPPRSVLEVALDEKEAEVRDAINTIIINHDSADWAGEALNDTRQEIIDTLSGMFKPAFGEITKVLFRDIIFTA